MSGGFVHSVKPPRLYKAVAKIVQKVEENGASLKHLIYEDNKHPRITGVYALAITTLQNAPLLAELLQKTRILLKEQRLDPWLARVLIAELLWGKKSLNSEAKPIRTVLSYENELRALLETLDKPITPEIQKVKKPRYVRVNTLVSSIEDIVRSFTDDEWILLPKSPDYSSYLITLSRLNGSWFAQDFHIPELLAFPSGTRFHDDPRLKSGSIVLQDKASCFPAFLLKPDPGSTVLDMCAAPGMKTTHLAAIMQNEGKVFAIERDKRRYETLCKLVLESGASCVTTLNADSMTIDEEKCPNVEYILVDPSCSGSGMSDRMIFGNNDSKCSPGRLRSLQSFQVLLLRHALCNFPRVKRVIYSTCSVYPEENETVVDEILGNIGESYELRSVEKLLDGHWKNFSSEDYSCGKKCLYAKPETDYSNGFFVAVFERNFDVPLPKFKRGKAFVQTGGGDNFEANQLGENKPDGMPTDATSSKKKKKKRKRDEVKNAEVENEDESLIEKKKSTNEEVSPSVGKKRKKKKNKSSGVDVKEENFEALPTEEPTVDKPAKKKKKHKKGDSVSETT